MIKQHNTPTPTKKQILVISDCDFLWGECVSCMVAHGVTMLGKLHAHGTRYSLIVCIRKSSVTKLTQSRHIAFVPGF